MYEAYLKMTPTELHKHLRKRNLHPHRMKQIEEDVAIMKEAKRTERITRTVYRQAWRDLMQPLRYELNNARVGLRYCVRGKVLGVVERREAFEAYIKVMETLLRKLEMPSTQLAQTPRQYAQDLNDRKKGSPITNEGQHWTDWVPAHIKHAIITAFAALPYKPRTKRKIPFQPMVTPAQHARRKAMLLKRTTTEHMNAERAHTMNPTEENATKLSLLTDALKIIENLQPNEFVPATWHNLDI
jgi:hypothetical protein